METRAELRRRNQTQASKKRPARSGTTRPPKGPKGSKKKRGIVFKIFITLFSLLFIGLLLGGGFFAYYAVTAPKLDDSKLTTAQSSKIYDKNNKLIADLGTEQRELISPDKVPTLLAESVVSVEDKRFYENMGVDPTRIVGSLVHNLTHSTTQGGSTLTQQLIKLSYFSTEESDQTLKRKAQEAWLALQLDRVKSKDEILTYYMNKVYMANGLYGMRTASKAYFGVEPEELTLPQAALIAGIPQAPNLYNPYTNEKAAKERRDVVLLTLLNNGKIDKDAYQEAVQTPVTEGLKKLKNENSDLKVIDNYLKEVISEVKDRVGLDLFKKGVNVYTNIDMNAQKRLYKIVNSKEYINFPDDKFQVAATLIDVKTGKVTAQIGGRKIPEDVTFGTNQAVQTNRDFGSTMKPLTDYGPAIEYLDWPTNHMLQDIPYKYPGTDIEVHDWDNQFMGAMTMRRALTLSRNIPAIEALDAVGVDNALKFLKKSGIQYKQLVYSNAISSNTEFPGDQYGASSEKMAAAYAAFSNGGIYNKPYYVNKIVFEDGTVQTYNKEASRAMKASTAYMVTDMMKNVISSGTGNNAQIPGLIQAGKTGTSNYSDDELKEINSPYQGIAPADNFVGITPSYSLAIWTGYTNRKIPILPDDFMIASEVYKFLMEYVSESQLNEDWVMPANVQRIGTELSLINSNYNGAVYQPTVTQSSKEKTESSEEKEESSTTSESKAETTPQTSSSENDQTSSTSAPAAQQPTESSTSSSVPE
ncbi:MAG: PBP1A family penicillin-binding protein [Streptococcaceae bacterium]|jgi:penicillin-binding protein 1A|nr:PBP1A family penicillin-binding protein [Streptococcaceae bacterium]